MLVQEDVHDIDNKKIKQSKSRRTMVKFVIKDTGAGVSEENQSVIFQKYQQANISVARHFGGTGLGLSICQSLVERMGGTIGVDSTLGKGSSFWVVLPADIPSEEEEEQQELSEEDPAKDTTVAHRLNVLVAEDNKVNQKLLANMLRRMGHTSTIAENGKQAIELVQRESFDIVLMDIQMPVMDGFEATRRLRTMGYADLAIYGLTASMTRSDFTELGFNDWLPKPMTMKDLKAKLHDFGTSLNLIQPEAKQ